MLLLKQIDDNLYLVDTEAEIKTGDLCTCDLVAQPILRITNLEYAKQYSCKKIIAQLKDQLSGVPLFTLPEEKVDVEKLASDYIEKHKNDFDNWKDKAHAKVGYTMGYHRCLSDNEERKYSEEDMLKAYKEGSYNRVHKGFKEFIQSLTTPNLQQYDVKEVEIETYTDTVISGGLYSDIPSGLKRHEVEIPKLTNGKITITKML